MTDKPHVYNLPGEVAAAISTNRPQFVTMLIDKVRNGHVIEQKHVIGVLEAFRDIVQMRADDRARVQRLERYIKRLTDASKGIDKVEAQLRRTCQKLGSGEPLEEDEDEVT